MNLKKIIASVIAVTLVCGTASSFNGYQYNCKPTVYAADLDDYDPASDYDYVVLDDGTVTIISYTGHHSDLKIPPYIEGKPVTKLEDNAFGFYSISLGYETQLTSVVIPDTVTWIGDHCFHAQRKLTDITIPENLDHIGAYAFNVTPWLDAHTDESGLVYVSGFLIEGMNCDSTIIVKDGTKGITEGAFLSSNLENIYIPSSVKSIGKKALESNEDLTVYCDEGSCAEEYAKANGIVYVADGSKPDIDENRRIVDKEDNYRCILGSDGVFTVIGTGDMKNYKYAQDIPWYDCADEIKSVVIGDGITSIGNGNFNECNNMTKITIPDSVTSIGEWAFKDCENLTDIMIPNSVESIGVNCFKSCSSLKEITIPESVTSIDGGVFCFCSNLEKITILGQISEIGVCTFFGCSSLSEITLPDSVERIDYQAFCRCNKLEEINIPKSVSFIAHDVFTDTPWFEEKRSKDQCVVVNDILIDGTLLEGEVIIPDNVKRIAPSAFYGCKGITKVTMPDTVISIHQDAFYGCSGITEIVIPDSVTSIGRNAFDDCLSLKKVIIPESVTSIGAFAFYNTPWFEEKRSEDPCVVVNGIVIDGKQCEGDVIIPDNVTVIGSESFWENKLLTSVTIPDGVISIGEEAFSDCGFTENSASIAIACGWTGGFPEITIPASVKSIGKDAFSYNSNLKKITILSTNVEIGYAAFYGCSKNAEIYGYSNSTAAKYALANNIKFIPLDDTSTTTTTTTTSTTTSTTTTSEETTTSSSQTTVKEPFEMVSDSRVLGVWELYKIVDSETGEESDFDPANVLYRYTFTDDFRCVVHLSQLTGENKMEKDTLCSWTAAESVTGGKNRIYMEIVGEDEKSEAQIIDLVDGELVVAPYVGMDSSVRFYMKKVDDSPVKAGDVNEDGIINAVDASRILVFYATLNAGEVEVTENDITVCDINKDKMINAVDASLILAYYANLNADPDLTLEAFLEDKLNK